MTKRKVKLGKPIPWSEAALDRLTEITQTDIDRANVLWRDNAPRKFDGLLEAEPKPDELTNG